MIIVMFAYRFQVVDMRWGVTQEAQNDHMTSTVCLKEIKNCQRLSVGPDFVVCFYPFIPNL